MESLDQPPAGGTSDPVHGPSVADSGEARGGTVLIVDDHELFGTTVRMALRAHGLDPHQLIPDGACTAETIIRRAMDLPPGLIVLDLDLGEGADGRPLRGEVLVPELRKLGWTVLVVSGSRHTQQATAAAIAAGAIGAVPKSSSFDTLLAAVVTASIGQPLMTEADHQMWMARYRNDQALDRELIKKLGRLSHREREVLELLGQGQRAHAIADHIMVSITTVRTQIRAILTKLDVSSQLEAVALLERARRELL